MNQVWSKWARALGWSRNLATGNYATIMERNAQANQNLCMAIWLQLNEDNFICTKHVGNWVFGAEVIELCVGSGVDETLVLSKKYLNFFWKQDLTRNKIYQPNYKS